MWIHGVIPLLYAPKNSVGWLLSTGSPRLHLRLHRAFSEDITRLIAAIYHAGKALLQRQHDDRVIDRCYGDDVDLAFHIYR